MTLIVRSDIQILTDTHITEQTDRQTPIVLRQATNMSRSFCNLKEIFKIFFIENILQEFLKFPSQYLV